MNLAAKIMAIVLPALAIGVAAGWLTSTDQTELAELIGTVVGTVIAAGAAIWKLWQWVQARWFTEPTSPEPQPQPGPPSPLSTEPTPLPHVVRTRPGIPRE